MEASRDTTQGCAFFDDQPSRCVPTGAVVAAELKLVNLRVRQTTEYGDSVLPVLLAGDARTSLSPQLQPLVCVDFRDTSFYFRKLFDMIWRLYDLPFDNPLLEELQASMTPQER